MSAFDDEVNRRVEEKMKAGKPLTSPDVEGMEGEQPPMRPDTGRGLPNFGGGGIGRMLAVSAIVAIVVVMGMGTVLGGGPFVTKTDFTKNIQGMVTANDQAKADLAKTLSAVTTAVQGIPKTVTDSVSASVNQATSQFTSQVNSLKTSVDAATANVNSMVATVNDLKSKITAMQAKIDAYEARIVDLEDALPNPDDAPTITSFTPTSGNTGTSVVITGTNFTGATSVTFGLVAVQSFTVNSATQITAVVGNGATGGVGVTTPDGSGSSSGTFTFTGVTIPTVTSFTPMSGGTGTSVVIYGTNFSGVTSVSFGGMAAQSFVVNSTTQITAVVGSGSIGLVSVSTSTGTGASASSFSYVGASGGNVITTFSPTTVIALPNMVNISVTNNSGKDVFGGQFSLTLQYLDATPSTTNLATLSSSEITWAAGASISGISATHIGSATGVYILSGQTRIITVSISSPASGTQFRVSNVVYTGYMQ